MGYIKNWKLYLEDLEVNPTDSSDIKMAKEKLKTLRDQINEFNLKTKEIDAAYKSNNEKTIKDMENKIFGTTDIRNGSDRNEFLVKYLSIAKSRREIDKMTNSISSDNLNLIKSQDILKVTTDNEIKVRYQKEIPIIQKRIDDNKNKIQKLTKEINDNILKIQNDMKNRESELKRYIESLEKS